MQQPAISPSSNTPSSSLSQPIKLEPQSPLPPPRPQAIFLNCFPSLLPLLQSSAEQFCNKYLDPCHLSTIDNILRGVSLTGEIIQRSKGIRELVAAVFYSQHPGVIRLRLKDFVRVNQLGVRVFNRKYTAYQGAIKRQRGEREEEGEVREGPIVKKEEDESCKSQQSQKQQEPPMHPEDQHSTNTQSRPLTTIPLHPIPITSPKEAIQLIFDGLFKTPSFQTHRRATISKMSQRCEQLPPGVYSALDWTESRPLRILYAVYGRLRQLGMSVGFTRYREAVEERTGYFLKRGWARRAERVVKEMVREEEGEE